MTTAQWVQERLEKAENRTKDLEKWVDSGVKPTRTASSENQGASKKSS